MGPTSARHAGGALALLALLAAPAAAAGTSVSVPGFQAPAELAIFGPEVGKAVAARLGDAGVEVGPGGAVVSGRLEAVDGERVRLVASLGGRSVLVEGTLEEVDRLAGDLARLLLPLVPATSRHPPPPRGASTTHEGHGRRPGVAAAPAGLPLGWSTTTRIEPAPDEPAVPSPASAGATAPAAPQGAGPATTAPTAPPVLPPPALAPPSAPPAASAAPSARATPGASVATQPVPVPPPPSAPAPAGAAATGAPAAPPPSGPSAVPPPVPPPVVRAAAPASAPVAAPAPPPPPVRAPAAAADPGEAAYQPVHPAVVVPRLPPPRSDGVRTLGRALLHYVGTPSGCAGGAWATQAARQVLEREVRVQTQVGGCGIVPRPVAVDEAGRAGASSVVMATVDQLEFQPLATGLRPVGRLRVVVVRDGTNVLTQTLELATHPLMAADVERAAYDITAAGFAQLTPALRAVLHDR